MPAKIGATRRNHKMRPAVIAHHGWFSSSVSIANEAMELNTSIDVTQGQTISQSNLHVHPTAELFILLTSRHNLLRPYTQEKATHTMPPTHAWGKPVR
uniref:Uncharacterized protein n=1 Tax=Arion vulgaris TaxID=1028688 RepID=A0A0B6ZWU1_9EUPU